MQTNPKAWSRNSFVLLVTVWACLLFPTGVLSEEKEAERDKPIVLSDSARRALDLQTTIIRPKPVSVAISTVGKVEAIPTREFVQHAPLSGRVIEVLIKLGDRVAAGQTLAMLNSPEINILASETLQTKSQVESEIKRSRAELDAEISQARAQVELTQANYSRDKQLYEEQIGSLKTMQTSSAELKVAESRLQMASKKKEAVMEGLATKLKLTSDSLIRRLQQLGATSSHVQKMLKEQRTILYVPLVSAREGVISRIDTSPGQSIDPADPLFVVSDLRKVWATANIYENDMSAVSIGQPVELMVAAYPQKNFKGVVTFISSTVDAATRTLPVKVEINNSDLSLKPGMFATLSVLTSGSRSAILIPRNALIQDGDKYIVFVAETEGYRSVFVQIGKSFGKDVEIAGGVTPGQQVVVKGAFQLDAERLKLHGQTDLFTHPSEEAEEEHEGSESAAGRTTQSQTLLLLGIAFLLGIAITVLFFTFRGRRAAPPGPSKSLSPEQDQISSHAE